MSRFFGFVVNVLALDSFVVDHAIGIFSLLILIAPFYVMNEHFEYILIQNAVSDKLDDIE